MTSRMDLPTQRDTDNPTATPDTDLPQSDLGGAVTDDTAPDGDTTATDVEGTPLDGLSDTDRTALHAKWDAEIDTILRVKPGEVLLAENVRTDNAEADEDTTANFKTHGVKTAVNGYRDYDTGTIVVTEGQRRVLNAREAGCTVPVWMKTPPPADERKATIERIVNQFIENDPALRRSLTLADTARALQQLAAFNLKPAGIARKLALGKKGKTYVENVLQAGRSELAVKASERFQLDLLQAAVIAEFDEAGDPDTAKELIRIAREAPNNFTVFAARKRTERDENSRFKALSEDLIEELTNASITIFDTSLSAWDADARSLDRLRPTPEDAPQTELAADDHKSCPGHGAWLTDRYDDDCQKVPVAVYGCADFRAHGHALSYAPAGRIDFTSLPPIPTGTSDEAVDLDNLDDVVTSDEIAAARAVQAASELERQKARIIDEWVNQNSKDWDASEAPRREWLAALVQRKTAPQGAQLFLALQKAEGSKELRYALESGHPLAIELLGMPDEAIITDLTAKIAKASTAGKATLYDLFLTLCAIEDELSSDTWRSPWGAAQAYMAAIIGWGYPASDVERKVIDPETEQEVIAAQLGDLATGLTSDGPTTAESGEADGAEAPNAADHAEVEDAADGVDNVDDTDADADAQSDTAADHTEDATSGTDQEPVEQDAEAEAEQIGAAV
ncbi:hypothetical protein [Amycolatopsis sp. NPDC004625]|uniref:hypothetical protein n=1 Tax=Amycolatopsis sp. NPDC004625 TaxID=3154670 RepID=UPI0033B275A2